MEKSLLYLHGYNSSGNAFKARQLHAMFPEYGFVSPDFHYETSAPRDVLRQIVEIVEANDIVLAVGSSTGGYYGLSMLTEVQVPVLAVNPVTDFPELFRRMAARGEEPFFCDDFREKYVDFQENVFEKIPLPNPNVNLALALDDELLGSHESVKQRFANCGKVVELDHCGHHFTRFGELKAFIKTIMETRTLKWQR